LQRQLLTAPGPRENNLCRHQKHRWNINHLYSRNAGSQCFRQFFRRMVLGGPAAATVLSVLRSHLLMAWLLGCVGQRSVVLVLTKRLSLRGTKTADIQ
jgi:hypothetical protein